MSSPDGYIRNKMAAIAEARKTIAAKYATSCFILIFIPILLFAIMVDQPPEEWTSVEVEYSHISLSRIGLRRGRSQVLNAKDGKQYAIAAKFVDVEELRQLLIPGQKYSIVYSRTADGGMHIEALYDQNTVFQEMDQSLKRWERERKQMIVSIFLIIGAEAVALILIDRLWCKTDHARIRKLKADIERRKLRMDNRKPDNR